MTDPNSHLDNDTYVVNWEPDKWIAILEDGKLLLRKVKEDN